MSKSPDPDNFDGMTDDEILGEIRQRRADAANGLDPHERFVEKYRRRGQARINEASGKQTLWNSIFHPFKFDRNHEELMDAYKDYNDTLDRSIRESRADTERMRAERLAAEKYRK